MGLRLVDHVVDPASRLLHAEAAPFVLAQESAARHLLEEGFGQEDVAILVLIVFVFLAVLDFVWKIRHGSQNCAFPFEIKITLILFII